MNKTLSLLAAALLPFASPAQAEIRTHVAEATMHHGVTYQAERGELDGTWLPVGPPLTAPADGPRSVTVPLVGPRQFYRVEAVQ